MRPSFVHLYLENAQAEEKGYGAAIWEDISKRMPIATADQDSGCCKLVSLHPHRDHWMLQLKLSKALEAATQTQKAAISRRHQ